MESQPTARRAIAKKFAVAARIESHGESRLYRATQADTGRVVALRELVPAHITVAESLRRLTRLAAVTSRFLVDVVDAGPLEEDHVYVAHAMLDGESLTERIARKKELLAPEAAALCVRVLKALSSLHKRELVHGGLRPSRVFHERVRKGGWHIKVLGACVHSVTREQSNAAAELARYSPPEWLAGDAWSARGDVYALSAIFFELLAKRPVFEGDDADAVRRNVMTGLSANFAAAMPDASAELRQLLADGLALDADARPADAAAMLERLLVLYPEPEATSDGPARAVEHWTRGGVVNKPAAAPLELPPVPESRTSVARRQKRAVRSTAVTTAAVTAICTAGIGAALYLRAQRHDREQDSGAAHDRAGTSAPSGTTAAASLPVATAPPGASSLAALPAPPPPRIEPANGTTSAATNALDAGAATGRAPGAADASVAELRAAVAAIATARGPIHARPLRPPTTGGSNEPPAASGAPAPGGATTGMLEFRTVTACSFVLDGRLYGRLSMTELNLLPGRHEITCHSSTSTQQLIVRVYAGQRTRVHVGSSGEAEISTEAAPGG